MLADESAVARKALDDACATGDVDLIADTIHTHLWPLYDRHLARLQEAVSNVSGETLSQYPVLRMLHPMAPALASSSAPFDASSLDDVPMTTEIGRDAIATMKILAARMSGDLRASSEYARELTARVYEMDVPARAQRGSILWFLHYEIGSARLLVGDTSGAVRELTTARDVGRVSGSPDAERACLVRLALAEVLRGSVGDAEDAIAAARGLPEPTGPYAAPSRSTEAVAAALIAAERGELSDAALSPAASPLDSTAFTWAFATLARARSFLLQGRPTDALESARVAASTHRVQEGTLPADVLTRIYVEAFLILGNQAAAARAAQQPRELGAMVAIALIRLDLARGDLDSASARLQKLAMPGMMAPAAESELICLRTWEMVARGVAGPDAARRFVAVLTNRDARRIVASTPRWVVDAVAVQVPDDIRSAFDAAVGGLRFPDIGRSTAHLTSSERRVLALLPEHERIADMASALFLSPNTVKTHLSSLYRKLGVSSRREAIEARRALLLIDTADVAVLPAPEPIAHAV